MSNREQDHNTLWKDIVTYAVWEIIVIAFFILILSVPIIPYTYTLSEPVQMNTNISLWKDEPIFPGQNLTQVVSIPENSYVIYEVKTGIPLEDQVDNMTQFPNGLPSYFNEGTNVKIEFNSTSLLSGEIYFVIVDTNPIKGAGAPILAPDTTCSANVTISWTELKSVQRVEYESITEYLTATF